jgi:hypothetical protein
MTIETKKHRLVLRRFFHSEAALLGGRVAAKKHPREGGLLERFPVAHEIGGFTWPGLLCRRAYVERLLSKASIESPGEQS